MTRYRFGSKEEFVQNFMMKSGLSPDFVGRYVVVLPCRCGCEACPGWAVVANTEDEIAKHEKEYG